MTEALKQIVDLLQPVAALADGTPFENSEVIQRCVDATEIALEALAQPAQRPWVGLTEAQFLEATRLAENGNYLVAFVRIQEWLKEQNT